MQYSALVKIIWIVDDDIRRSCRVEELFKKRRGITLSKIRHFCRLDLAVNSPDKADIVILNFNMIKTPRPGHSRSLAAVYSILRNFMEKRPETSYGVYSGGIKEVHALISRICEERRERIIVKALPRDVSSLVKFLHKQLQIISEIGKHNSNINDRYCEKIIKEAKRAKKGLKALSKSKILECAQAEAVEFFNAQPPPSEPGPRRIRDEQRIGHDMDSTDSAWEKWKLEHNPFSKNIGRKKCRQAISEK